MNAATLGPNGSDSSAAMYSRAEFQVLARVERIDNVLARNRLDSAEKIAGVRRAGVNGGQGTRSDKDRRDSVSEIR